MMSAITFRRLLPDDAALLGQIDRSETVSRVYSVHNGQLRSRAAPHEIPAWSTDFIADNPTFHLDFRAERLRSRLADGWIGTGAFDHGALVGCCVLRLGLTETTAQVAELFVSRSHRRAGIGAQLMQLMGDDARRSGARHLYVSAVPTEGAVNFYLSQGFRLNPEPHPELLSLEPDDIHMITDLGRPLMSS
jgi:GNAT superfamily N-acetyltransferase